MWRFAPGKNGWFAVDLELHVLPISSHWITYDLQFIWHCLVWLCKASFGQPKQLTVELSELLVGSMNTPVAPEVLMTQAVPVPQQPSGV
jgi:hypothetical protein